MAITKCCVVLFAAWIVIDFIIEFSVNSETEISNSMRIKNGMNETERV